MNFNKHVRGNILHLSYVKVDINQLISFLQENRQITGLILIESNINGKEVKALANSNLTNLTSLHLGGNNIGEEGTKALANGNLTNLTELYLRGNNIGEEGAKALANGNLTNLTELYLRGNNIGEEGAKALANGNLTNLTELYLESNRIGEEGAKALANGNLTNLTSLDLRGNNIGNEGAKALANGNLTNLTSLDLMGNNIGEEGAKALANGNLTNLTELYLRGNNIGEEGAKALANGNLTNLTSLDLMGNNIGEEGAKALANGNLTNLTSLDLMGNNIGEKRVKALAESEENCKLIDKLDYRNDKSFTDLYKHLKELWSQARTKSNSNISKLDEDTTKRLFFYLAQHNHHKKRIELFLDDFDKYPFNINSRNEQGHTLAHFYTHDPEMQKFFFERGMIPEERNQEREDKRIAQDNQSVHASPIVKRTNFLTKKLVESTKANKEELKQAVSSYVESIELFNKEYQNDTIRLRLLDLNDDDKKSVMEETLGNNPVPDDKEFIQIVIDTSKNALETKYLRKNTSGEYDEGYPIYEMEYEDKAKVTIPESIGYIKLMIDNFSIPLEEKKELLVTLIEQNPELVRKKIPIIRKELGNSDILNEAQFKKKELYILLNSIDDSKKIDKLFKEISDLDVENIWREQKEFALLKHIYMAATGYRGESVCPHGTWTQIINSIQVINTEIMEQFDLYLEEKEKREAQKNVITEENIKPFIEDLANKLIEYVELHPELKEALKDFAISIVEIDEPEEITLEQQKILAEINKYFSQNIKKFLQNYDRNIPSRNECDLIIKELSGVGVMQRFAREGQAPSNAEDNSNSYATISTDEELLDDVDQELLKFQAEEIETQIDISKTSMDLFTRGESNSRTTDAITNFSTAKTPALEQESDKNEQATTQLTGYVIQEDFIQVLQPKSLVNIRDNNIQIVDEITQVAEINPDERTSLHDAAEIGDTEGVNALVKEKDINARDRYGRTPLHYAASKGHTEILRSLLDAGAKFDEKDNVGMTPLCLDIVNDYQEIVETLVEKGANVNVVSKSGKTPLDWLSISRHTWDDLCSSNCSHTEIEEILLKNGAVGNTENSTIYDNVQAKSVQLNNPENKSTSTISDQLQTLTQEHAISSDNEYEQAECSVTIPENQSNFGTIGSNSFSYSSEEQLLLKVSASDNKQGIQSESESESEDNKSNITMILADTKKEKQTPTHKQDISNKDNSKSKPKENNVISQNKKMYIVATSALVVAGIISGIAIAVYSGILAVGIALGVCCLIAAAVIYCCNSPSNLLKGSNPEVAVNQGKII